MLEAEFPHRKSLRGLAHHLAPDTPTAEDLLQETYLRAYSLGGPERPLAYQQTILLNLNREGYRQKKPAPLEGQEWKCERTPYPWARIQRGLALSALSRAMERLSDQDAHLIRIHFMDGRNSREVAQHLGCSQSTLRRRRARILRALRRDLEGNGADWDSLSLSPGSESSFD